MSVLITADGNTLQLGNVCPMDYVFELVQDLPTPVVLVQTDREGRIQTWRFRKYSNGKRLVVTKTM